MRRALLLIAAALLLALGLAAARAEGATTVYLLRATSSEWIPAGGHVALSYTLRAAGGDGAKDVVITDPLVGEVARIIARRYGEQSSKPSDEGKDLGDELTDVLWVVMCLANQTGVDLDAALERNFAKKTSRDANRHKENEKLLTNKN